MTDLEFQEKGRVALMNEAQGRSLSVPLWACEFVGRCLYDLELREMELRPWRDLAGFLQDWCRELGLGLIGEHLADIAQRELKEHRSLKREVDILRKRVWVANDERDRLQAALDRWVMG